LQGKSILRGALGFISVRHLRGFSHKLAQQRSRWWQGLHQSPNSKKAVKCRLASATGQNGMKGREERCMEAWIVDVLGS
jgi:hypothetical protein